MVAGPSLCQMGFMGDGMSYLILLGVAGTNRNKEGFLSENERMFKPQASGGSISGSGCPLPKFMAVGDGFRFSTLQWLKPVS